MGDVFEGGQGDARQGVQAAYETEDPFRKRYRQLIPAEIELHDAIKTKAAELWALCQQVKPGRYRALGITSLEQAVMWVVKELTS